MKSLFLSPGRATAIFLATSAFSSLHAAFLDPGIGPGNTPWPGGIVPYVIDPALSAAQQQTYLDGLREWELAGAVHFVARTTETNYAFYKYDPAGPNQFSGSQPQVIEINALTRAQICHEMGHSFGLRHEHTRPDRDNFVTVLSSNITAGNAFWFDLDTAGVPFGAYDFESVMHFAPDLYSVNPGVLDTLSPQPGFERYQVRMGNFAISPGDRAALAYLYGAVTLSPLVTQTGDAGPGSLRAALYYATDHPGTTIRFSIPTSDPGYSGGVFTIHASGYLPPLVTNGTVLDGTSQPGYAGAPLVFVDGSQVLPEAGDPPGLLVYASSCTIKGLAFIRARWVGLALLYPDATGNVIASCWSGVGPGGSLAQPNTKQGVEIGGGAHDNLIGPANLLSGNTEYGVYISDSTTTGNSVRGNRIGTNATGDAALANGLGGVIVTTGAKSNTIDGANVISGNQSAGIWLTGAGVTNNLVRDNLIGLNAAGSGALPNSFAGVYVLAGASGNLVQCNVLSGHPSEGLRISDGGTSGNSVEANLVGTNAAGTSAIGNGFAGVTVFGGASGNTISGNVLAGNTSYGAVIGDSGSNGNQVSANLIGLLRNRAALGNGVAGIAIWGGAQGNSVSGNLIDDNGSYGIALFDAATTFGNSFTSNSISDNAFSGISVGAANHAQAAPSLTAAVAGVSGITVTGTLTSTPGASFKLEFFANAAPGTASGEIFLGALGGVATNNSGLAAFNPTLGPAVLAGKVLTATATNEATGDTSEFSAPVLVTAIDTDHDGMPDAYEIAHGLNPVVDDAALDADGDGASNLSEYLAGTDPQDAADVLGAISATCAGNNLTLKFRCVAGHVYQVEQSTTLAADSWQIVVPLQLATTNELDVVVPFDASVPRAFYRARVME